MSVKTLNEARWYAVAIALIALVAAPSPAAAADAPGYATAVLPFQASGAELKDVGAEVTSLVATHLSTEPGLVMVQRAELDKVLAEKELGLSGTVSPETAARIGNLTGAKVLVTGRVFAVRNELVLVAQVIGTETGRTYGETVSIPLRDPHTRAAQELARRWRRRCATRVTRSSRRWGRRGIGSPGSARSSRASSFPPSPCASPRCT